MCYRVPGSRDAIAHSGLPLARDTRELIHTRTVGQGKG